jgi:hypothetical protein
MSCPVRVLIAAGIGLLLWLVVTANGAVGTAPGGGINATNQRSAGLYLRTDGTVDFWDTPTTSATNAQPTSTALTNLSTLYFNGTGTPEGSVSARVGAIYLCTNSCSGSGTFVKTNGTGNTGWWQVQDTTGGSGLDTNSSIAFATNVTINGTSVVANLRMPNLTTRRVMITDSQGRVTVDANLSDTELAQLDGISLIKTVQTQLDERQATNSNLTSISSLADPNADRIAFWDDSAGAWTWLSVGANLSITGTTIDASGGSGSTNNAVTAAGTTLAGQSYLTNAAFVSVTNSTATNWSLIWPGPDIVRLAPTGRIDISEAGAPSAGGYYQRKDLFLLTQQTVGFPAAWKTRDGSLPVVVSGITNRFIVEFDGTNTWVESLQRVVTDYGINTAFPTDSLTNFWADFGFDQVEINATNNVHFNAATNQPSAGARYLSIMISTFGGANRVLSFNTNVFSLVGTNHAVIRSNTLAVVNIVNRRGTNRLASYNIQSLP